MDNMHVKRRKSITLFWASDAVILKVGDSKNGTKSENKVIALSTADIY